MKILITGVSGFIGQALVRDLYDDYAIYGIYEHAQSRAKNPELEPERQHVVDLRDVAVLENVIKRIQPDFVFHLAARSEVANSFDNYHEVGQINYGGTVALAEANRRFNPNLKLFVMASTMETYGYINPRVPVREETIQRPMAPYAVAKRASELYLDYMTYAYDFPSVVLRQTNAYGRHDNDFFVMERMITQMLVSDVINLGDPNPMRNFLYIDDLVSLYRTLLTKVDQARGRTFVTGPDNALSIGTLQKTVAEIMDWKGEVHWYTIPARPGEIFYLNSNPKYAEDTLGWKPTTSLGTGIRKTIEMWK